MLRASIDLGTNTCLLLVAEVDSEGRVTKIISDNSTIVRLGEGVDRARELQPAAIERTLTCLKSYAEISRKAGVEPKVAICVATSSSRDSKNGAQFFAQVEKETGFRFRVISGGDEARYTFLGALLPGFPPADTAVIDIGGGSTEFITEAGPSKIDGFSLDVGSVRFTERFFKSDRTTPVTDEEFWACQDAIDEILKKAVTWRERHSRVKNLIAVAGTATTLAAWHLELTKFDASKLDACQLTRGDVHRMVEELKWRTVEERAKLPGMTKGREDVLLAGALVLWRAMELLSFNEIQISTRGLRFGVMQLRDF
jgi:exopolyphosphatase / guanosine-5'-triphosphate,3'-diphosphate pyrophosphatase